MTKSIAPPHPPPRARALRGRGRGRASGPRALAQQGTDLTVFGHRVHQAAAVGGPGGDATEAWRKQSGANVSWVTLGDVNAIHERLLREATLSSTTFDVAYLLNGRAVPKNLQPVRAARRLPEGGADRGFRRFRAGPSRAAPGRRRAPRHPGAPRHERHRLQRGAVRGARRRPAEDLRGDGRGGAQAHVQARRRHAGLRPRVHAGLRLELPDHLALPRRRLHDRRTARSSRPSPAW